MKKRQSVNWGENDIILEQKLAKYFVAKVANLLQVIIQTSS